jgi:tRNA A22 N-methylase
MKKFSLTVSYGDLKWMSEVYFELYSLHLFLKRFYEIIGDEEENKRFCEALKSYYYFPDKTMEEAECILDDKHNPKTEEELQAYYKRVKEIFEILKKFGF